jgi:hypothetical protein
MSVGQVVKGEYLGIKNRDRNWVRVRSGSCFVLVGQQIDPLGYSTWVFFMVLRRILRPCEIASSGWYAGIDS